MLAVLILSIVATLLVLTPQSAEARDISARALDINISTSKSLLQNDLPTATVTGFESEEVFYYEYRARFDSSSELLEGQGAVGDEFGFKADAGYELFAHVVVRSRGSWIEFEVPELYGVETQGQDRVNPDDDLSLAASVLLAEDLPPVAAWSDGTGGLTSIVSPQDADPRELALMHGIISDFGYTFLGGSAALSAKTATTFTASEERRSGMYSQTYSKTPVDDLAGAVGAAVNSGPKLTELAEVVAQAETANKTALFNGMEGQRLTHSGKSGIIDATGEILLSKDGLMVSRSIVRDAETRQPVRRGIDGGKDVTSSTDAVETTGAESVSIVLVGIETLTSQDGSAMNARISAGKSSRLTVQTAQAQFTDARADEDLVGEALVKFSALDDLEKWHPQDPDLGLAQAAAIDLGIRAIRTEPNRVATFSNLVRSEGASSRAGGAAMQSLIGAAPFEQRAEDEVTWMLTNTSLPESDRENWALLAASIPHPSSSLDAALGNYWNTTADSQERAAKSGSCDDGTSGHPVFENFCWSASDRKPANGKLGFAYDAELAILFTEANNGAGGGATSFVPTVRGTASADAYMWSNSPTRIASIEVGSRINENSTVQGVAEEQGGCLAGSCPAEPPPPLSIIDQLGNQGIGVVSQEFYADLNIFNRWKKTFSFEVPCAFASEEIDLIAELRRALTGNGDPLTWSLDLDVPLLGIGGSFAGIVEFKFGIFLELSADVGLTAPFSASIGFCRAGAGVPYYEGNSMQADSELAVVLLDAAVRVTPEIKASAGIAIKLEFSLTFGKKKKKDQADGLGLSVGGRGTIASVAVPAAASASLVVHDGQLKVQLCYSVDLVVKLFYDFILYFALTFPEFLHDERIFLNTVSLRDFFDDIEAKLQNWLAKDFPSLKGTVSGRGITIETKEPVALFPNKEWANFHKQLAGTKCRPFEAHSANISVVYTEPDPADCSDISQPNDVSGKNIAGWQLQGAGVSKLAGTSNSDCGSISRVSFDGSVTGPDEPDALFVEPGSKGDLTFSYTNDTDTTQWITTTVHRLHATNNGTGAFGPALCNGVSAQISLRLDAGATADCTFPNVTFTGPSEDSTTTSGAIWAKFGVRTSENGTPEFVSGPVGWMKFANTVAVEPKKAKIRLSDISVSGAAVHAPEGWYRMAFTVDNEGDVAVVLGVFDDTGIGWQCEGATVQPGKSKRCNSNTGGYFRPITHAVTVTGDPTISSVASVSKTIQINVNLGPTEPEPEPEPDPDFEVDILTSANSIAGSIAPTIEFEVTNTGTGDVEITSWESWSIGHRHVDGRVDCDRISFVVDNDGHLREETQLTIPENERITCVTQLTAPSFVGQDQQPYVGNAGAVGQSFGMFVVEVSTDSQTKSDEIEWGSPIVFDIGESGSGDGTFTFYGAGSLPGSHELIRFRGSNNYEDLDGATVDSSSNPAGPFAETIANVPITGSWAKVIDAQWDPRSATTWEQFRLRTDDGQETVIEVQYPGQNETIYEPDVHFIDAPGSGLCVKPRDVVNVDTGTAAIELETPERWTIPNSNYAVGDVLIVPAGHAAPGAEDPLLNKFGAQRRVTGVQGDTYIVGPENVGIDEIFRQEQRRTGDCGNAHLASFDVEGTFDGSTVSEPSPSFGVKGGQSLYLDGSISYLYQDDIDIGPWWQANEAKSNVNLYDQHHEYSFNGQVTARIEATGTATSTFFSASEWVKNRTTLWPKVGAEIPKVIPVGPVEITVAPQISAEFGFKSTGSGVFVYEVTSGGQFDLRWDSNKEKLVFDDAEMEPSSIEPRYKDWLLPSAFEVNVGLEVELDVSVLPITAFVEGTIGVDLRMSARGERGHITDGYLQVDLTTPLQFGVEFLTFLDLVPEELGDQINNVKVVPEKWRKLSPWIRSTLKGWLDHEFDSVDVRWFFTGSNEPWISQRWAWPAGCATPSCLKSNPPEPVFGKVTATTSKLTVEMPAPTDIVSVDLAADPYWIGGRKHWSLPTSVRVVGADGTETLPIVRRDAVQSGADLPSGLQFALVDYEGGDKGSISVDFHPELACVESLEFMMNLGDVATDVDGPEAQVLGKPNPSGCGSESPAEQCSTNQNDTDYGDQVRVGFTPAATEILTISTNVAADQVTHILVTTPAGDEWLHAGTHFFVDPTDAHVIKLTSKRHNVSAMYLRAPNAAALLPIGVCGD